MKLNDAIRQEAACVFLDLEGFAEPLTIDNVPTVGIWNDSVGTLSGQKVLQLPSDAIPAPLAGQRLCIDGEYWTSLSDAEDQMGIMVLKLQRIHA